MISWYCHNTAFQEVITLTPGYICNSMQEIICKHSPLITPIFQNILLLGTKTCNILVNYNKFSMFKFLSTTKNTASSLLPCCLGNNIFAHTFYFYIIPY
jgi:hypothetical protein